jgi:hypothetical protein
LGDQTSKINVITVMLVTIALIVIVDLIVFIFIVVEVVVFVLLLVVLLLAVVVVAVVAVAVVAVAADRSRGWRLGASWRDGVGEDGVCRVPKGFAHRRVLRGGKGRLTCKEKWALFLT